MPNSKGRNSFTGVEFTTFYDQRGQEFFFEARLYFDTCGVSFWHGDRKIID